MEYPDRLARFGFPYLETLFEVLSVRIVVISNQEPEDAQAESVKDMLSVVTRSLFREAVRDAWRAQGGRKTRAAVKAVLAETEASAVG